MFKTIVPRSISISHRMQNGQIVALRLLTTRFSTQRADHGERPTQYVDPLVSQKVMER